MADRSATVLASTCLAAHRNGVRFETALDPEEESRWRVAFEALVVDAAATVRRRGLAVIGAPMPGDRFMLARILVEGEELRLRGLALSTDGYARLAAAGLWRSLEEEWIWRSPAFDTGLPVAIPIPDSVAPSPNAELVDMRDRLLTLDAGTGMSLVGDDAARTLLRILRRLTREEIAGIAWSIGIDPPPVGTRLAAGGPVPDGIRWVPPHRTVEVERSGTPWPTRVVRGGVPTGAVVLAGGLAAVSVLVAATMWIVADRDAAADRPAPAESEELRP